MVASAYAGDGGKEAREEADENDLLDDDGRDDACPHMQASNAVDVLMKYVEQIDFATADNML